MSEIRLTKDADIFICSIYKMYLERRKIGQSKDQAKSTGSSSTLHESLFPNMSFQDVDETCCELDRAGMLECFYADDVVYDSCLSDKAIIYMENRFKDGLSSVLSFLAQFIP